MNIKTSLKLIFAIIISELAGIVGSLLTFSSIPTWYVTVVKPSFSPPNWIFGPVWTTLYALMGVALFLVWQKGFARKDVKVAIALFSIQLMLNACWSIIFFGNHNIGGAFLEIIFLWIAIVATIISFFKISRPAGYLLLPYIAWVSFAAFLNYTLWTLN